MFCPHVDTETPTSTSQPQPEVGTKEHFFRHFQQEVNALEKQIEALKTRTLAEEDRTANTINNCLANIDRLSQEVMDASSYIPAYDRRTYGNSIKSLSEKLQTVRTASAPPKKFSFKKKTNQTTQTPDTNANALQLPGYSSNTSANTTSTATSPLPETRASQSGASPEQEITISNKTHSHITLPPPTSPNPRSATVSNITRSVIQLSPPTSGIAFATLTLKNIDSSLIITGHIDGPIHMTGISNSVIVTACRQFRMHSSKDVDVYLHCSSRPIIEDCEGIGFAELPASYTTSTLNSSPNWWNRIDDFKWLKFEPSPHFRLLPPEDRVKEAVWDSLQAEDKDSSLDDTLIKVNVPLAASPGAAVEEI